MPHLRVLLDLDGTLVDRQRAFEDWAARFVEEMDAGAEDLAWLIQADRGGYRPRQELAAAIVDRLGPKNSTTRLEQRLQLEVIEGIDCYPGVLDALRVLRDGDAELILVTNGTVLQQSAKIERTGLGPLLDRVVISEAVGVKKPDPRIFALAIDGLENGIETWMVGDHPSADIEGGRAAGCSTGWVSHGEIWPHPWEPTLSASTTREILRILAA
ncbi:HAD family hydrolase [uncultured Brachybacterium sp.]|uniref:HAD family hydrolase n=1 Tax=uncultured Brachybacterium sp. TaxID=189680 RepID=UPI00262BB707|nr:HAD family hydrolase [uncultured Brachybacterium sp.]